MKKRILAIVMVLALTLSLTVFASEEEKVEISFCIGDETLMINGQPVQVEKPYVVGEGVTLVPLRVITEAFGATVEWINETRTINITYPEVNIVLQIGNPLADVNGQATPMLSAPELTPAGFTMVPLRFISENFGATVSYDNASKRVTVVKQKNGESGSLLEGSITQPKVGDSYFDWSMKTPSDMAMTDRDFDGLYTLFEYDDNNFVVIEVNLKSKDYDMNAEFAAAKNSLRDLTLVKAEKNKISDSLEEYYIQVKDKSDFMAARSIASSKYVYQVWGMCEVEKEDMKNKVTECIESFECGFNTTDTYELSNVKNGKRAFEVKKLNLSIDVPANYVLASSEEVENQLLFIENTLEDFVSSIALEVYSKNEVNGAKTLAEKDFTDNSKKLNEEIATFSKEVSEATYNGITTYEYSYKIDGHSEKSYNKDMFFEKGSYVYNVAVSAVDIENGEDFAKEIINGIKADTIDENEVGVLLRNDFDDEGTYVLPVTDGEMTVPNLYENAKQGNVVILNNTVTGVTILHQPIASSTKATLDTAKRTLEEYEKAQKSLKNVEITDKTKSRKFGEKNYMFVGMSHIEEGEKYYVYTYATVNDQLMYTITVYYPELTYSEAARMEIVDIISSLKFK